MLKIFRDVAPNGLTKLIQKLPKTGKNWAQHQALENTPSGDFFAKKRSKAPKWGLGALDGTSNMAQEHGSEALMAQINI